MKIKMLHTRYDDDTNTKVYEENELFSVKETLNSFYFLKTVDGIDYGVEKDREGIEFIRVE